MNRPKHDFATVWGKVRSVELELFHMWMKLRVCFGMQFAVSDAPCLWPYILWYKVQLGTVHAYVRLVHVREAKTFLFSPGGFSLCILQLVEIESSLFKLRREQEVHDFVDSDKPQTSHAIRGFRRFDQSARHPMYPEYNINASAKPWG